MAERREMPPQSSDGSFVGKKIWITGHKGMLGSAMTRSLADEGAELLLTSRAELDLTDGVAVESWMKANKPEFIFHIGAKVGGIHANSTLPADFLLENLLIQSSVIKGAHLVGTKKLVFVASNCTYPTNAAQPISEDALLTGPLDSNIRAYAVSKIAGIEMCRAYRRQHGSNFISIIPPNLYGPGDNYHPQHSHVVAGILRRAHEAKLSGVKELVVWGDGTPRRELLHVDDLANAMKYVMLAPTTHDLYNIGCGHDLAIAELASIIADVVGFEGRVVYDTSKPNGTMRKLLDNSRILSLGWKPEIKEKDGLQSAYADFVERSEGRSSNRI
ncbi:GDP-L-fucose synthase [Rhizobium sp. VS19-DR104.2]|uniref:GDP-L-fucose synthase family protein n=1 Tax=unclassified Rhizobium TaxID=2613769 RepID=UPI001CC59EDA|nr:MULTISPECIES: GDP-L-fucose synthase [unclassified Rhizobium]MBZ5761973.1 GDP-L-fucose synthase [Rhizobium sp. VS19-DR96]MBZ5768381.1 GDP-L-fucose synthase [Rhizobium sp. VS19-DR129.2]MBZ5775651.1 GDP-L-fucose synthase [Rhizobium sp. VS19-DRK62.2]MBZ5786851.1 GDP-L-fucose synthase [Rhizobium sp. VS19-DR121]MBZ5804421.1 GDP-L-fucose synthase [Rhizobium sp. VS19-DR181]